MRCCGSWLRRMSTQSPAFNLAASRVMRCRSYSHLALALAGYQWDYVFDWTILKYQQTQQAGRPAADPGSATRQRDEREGASNFARATAGERSSRR